MLTSNNLTVMIDSFDVSGKCTLCVKSSARIEKVDMTVTERATGRVLSYSFIGEHSELCAPFCIENPTLWSIYSPNLYDYELLINGGGEKIAGTFGVRSLGSDGKNVTVNGSPVFIRGYIRGAAAHEHSNNAHLSEYEFYKKNISQAKKFGFNYVRFHSVVPHEEFFRAADELGMLVHIELREEKYNNLVEMVNTGTVIVSDEFINRVIDSLYNHPSLAVYCIGNEIKALGASERAKEIGELVRRRDPSRLFLDTCAWGENNREGVDIDVQHLSYYFPFGKHAGMYDNTDNLLVVGSGERELKSEGLNSSVLRTLSFNVPLIAHEVCHYTALRDFKALKAKFERYGTPAPWWIDEEIKMIKAKGFEGSYEQMYKASKSFQLECWKTAFEEMRRSKLLGGFQFLQFADTDLYENSNGLVDCFDDECYITPEQVSVFNGDETLLAQLPSRIFESGAEVSIPVSLSNCGEKSDTGADFSYSLTDNEGKVHASGALRGIEVGRRGLYDICKINMKLPTLDEGGMLTLDIKLENERGIFSKNSYKIWVYPRKRTLSYSELCSYERGGVMITDDIEKALCALDEGKRVCLVYRSDWTRHLLDKSMPSPKYAFRATWNRFKPVIWDRGTNYGGICDCELLKKYGFESGRFYDFNYCVVSEDCDKIILDDFPVKVRSIVRGIDKSVRDRFDAYRTSFNLPELQYDRTLRDFSYLFELSVGKGSLLVCGFNLTGIDNREPSSVSMADFIINYIGSSDFAPEAHIGTDELRAYLAECAKAPVKERMMTQFWQLDDTPVESKQYWEESRRYLTEG